jgi:hypothetical protein
LNGDSVSQQTGAGGGRHDNTGTLNPAGWATTEVDLETRRVRVLWGLAALGRSAQQRQFQSRCQAFMEIDKALADGYVQARYQHIIISLTTPGRPERSATRDRRRDPQALGYRTFMAVGPSVNRVEADEDNTGGDMGYGEAGRFWTDV